MSHDLDLPPQPAPDEDSLGFWEATEAGRLELCRCVACREWIQPPLERCRLCAEATRYEPVSGTGTVHSFIVVRHPSSPGYLDSLPYVIALVELDEQQGLRLPGRLTAAESDPPKIGDRVRVAFEDLPGGDFRIPVFHPDPSERA